VSRETQRERTRFVRIYRQIGTTAPGDKYDGLATDDDSTARANPSATGFVTPSDVR